MTLFICVYVYDTMHLNVSQMLHIFLDCITANKKPIVPKIDCDSDLGLIQIHSPLES